MARLFNKSIKVSCWWFLDFITNNCNIQLSDEILKVKNSILHYIEFDDLLNCEDLSLEVLSVNSKFSSAVGKLVSKIMAEENVTNG